MFCQYGEDLEIPEFHVLTQYGFCAETPKLPYLSPISQHELFNQNFARHIVHWTVIGLPVARIFQIIIPISGSDIGTCIVLMMFATLWNCFTVVAMFEDCSECVDSWFLQQLKPENLTPTV